jgi:hypothetical protein
LSEKDFQFSPCTCFFAAVACSSCTTFSVLIFLHMTEDNDDDVWRALEFFAMTKNEEKRGEAGKSHFG